MKELHLKCYDILNRIEQLNLSPSELNTSIIADLQRQYDVLCEVLFELFQNPVFMRYTKEPESAKSVVWEIQDKKLDFNETMQHINRTISGK